jgi:hypothetical protein
VSYLEQLKQQRTYAAIRCSDIAERIVLEGRTDALSDLHQWSIQRDALDRQISWMNRRTGWAWPVTPAWTD